MPNHSVYISEIEEKITKTDSPLPLTLSSSWNRKQGRRALRQTLVPLGLLGIKGVGQMIRYGTHHLVGDILDFRFLSHGLHQNCFKKSFIIIIKKRLEK
jgi:hypothetical protein